MASALHACLLGDACRAAVMIVAAAGTGVALNAWRADSLAWNRADRASRFLAEAGVPASDGLPVAVPGGMSLAELESAWRSGAVTVVDARPASFYRTGHIPGALNLPRERFAADFRGMESQLRGPSRPVVVYCQTASCDDAALVAKALQQAGLPSVRVFPGGWREWQANRKPEARGS